jgi:predicted PurR-regulated permease PerM
LPTEANSQKVLGTVFFYAIILLLAYLVYIVFAPFLVSLAWAAVLVVVSYPIYSRLCAKWGPTPASIAATAAVTLIIIVPTLFVLFAFVREAVNAAQTIQIGVETGRYPWAGALWAKLQHKFPNAVPSDLSGLLHQYAERGAAYIGERLGSALRHTAEFLFDVFVTVLAMFYLYRDGHSIVSRLRQVLPFEEERRERLVYETREVIYASVTSTLAAAGVHGALGGIAFAIAGVHSAVFWGVMMGFFSLVPLVGSALIWVPISVSLMIGGHLGKGIFLVLFCSLIVGLVDNVVRPWLISGRAEMSGLLIFISILGGIAVFGLLGVVLGPIVVAMAANILDLYGPTAPRREIGTKGGGKTQTAVLE